MNWLKALALLLIIVIPAIGAGLMLERRPSAEKWTYGTLKVDDLVIATTENTNTLIPVGTHKIILSYSPRFKKITPEILVKNREGIRIHGIAKQFALEGCVGISYADYSRLMAKLEKNNTITISVAKPPVSKLTYLKILLDKLIPYKVYIYWYAKMLYLSY